MPRSGRKAFRRDVGFTSDARIEPLGVEFGPGGPLCFEEALAIYTDKQLDDQVVVEYSSLGRRAFITAAKAKRVIAMAAEEGALVILEESQRTATLTFPKHPEWNPGGEREDPTKAERTQRWRASRDGSVTRPSDATVTPRDGDSDASRDSSDIEELPKGYEQRQDVLSLCDRLATAMRARDPKAKVAPRSRKWLDAARLLLDVDGRTVDEAERAIDWTQADSFWAGVIESMPKLRAKFTMIVQRMKQSGASGVSASDVERIRRTALRQANYEAGMA